MDLNDINMYTLPTRTTTLTTYLLLFYNIG